MTKKKKTKCKKNSEEYQCEKISRWSIW
jgi:hypothetical protein